MNTISFIGVHHAGGLGNDNFASTQNLSIDQINNSHYSRWPDFPSEINRPSGSPYYVGYNIVITPDGKFTQCRPIGAETAAQVGHNFDTISICVIGNFMKKSNGLPVDVMTSGQLNTLQDILKGILAQNFISLGLKVIAGTKFNLDISRIFPHRILQPNHTDCYGTYYPDDWARKLAIIEPMPSYNPTTLPAATPEDVANLLSWMQQIQLLTMKIKDLFAKKRFAAGLKFGSVSYHKRYGRACNGNL